ncbi:unnamed protein product [Nesidiocoris tenuis]|uniref:Uncharacterized protein n=1 Tax=Nesidiocoris tenuis TaxID=355587 RepID=A0A6H5GUE5_9HEMI|nr:unnamed protein product [Nesidiocoris tenuis]
MKDLFEFKDIIFCTSKVLDMGMRNEKQPISALNFLLDLPTNRQSNFLNAEHAQEPIEMAKPTKAHDQKDNNVYHWRLCRFPYDGPPPKCLPCLIEDEASEGEER